MFDYLKKIFNEEQNNSLAEQKASEKSNRKTEIAACALFIELAKADGEFSEDERKLIISEMKKTFNLDDGCINDLITLAEQKIKESVSLYEFTTIINNKFTQQEKIELIELPESNSKINIKFTQPALSGRTPVKLNSIFKSWIRWVLSRVLPGRRSAANCSPSKASACRVARAA